MVRERNQAVLSALKERGNLSPRKLSEIRSQSKDAVRRALKSIERKRVYEESHLWESELAQRCLHRMLYALLLTFVLERGVDVEQISLFLRRVRLDKEIGASALRSRLKKTEQLLNDYGQQQQDLHKEAVKDLVVGGDETFFHDKLILVPMEPSSGSILLEEISEDRRFETWQAAVKRKLADWGSNVRLFTSDRGKALIKLALDAFGCDAGADLFHAMQEVTRWQGIEFKCKLDKAVTVVNTAKAKLGKLATQVCTTSRKATQHKAAKTALEQAQAAEYKVKQGRQHYHDCLQALSIALHPFDLKNCAQSSTQVRAQFKAQLECLAQIAREHGINDRCGVIDKVKAQLNDLCSRVDAWWIWALETLDE